jgi:hypothetical protein
VVLVVAVLVAGGVAVAVTLWLWRRVVLVVLLVDAMLVAGGAAKGPQRSAGGPTASPFVFFLF